MKSKPVVLTSIERDLSVAEARLATLTAEGSVNPSAWMGLRASADNGIAGVSLWTRQAERAKRAMAKARKIAVRFSEIRQAALAALPKAQAVSRLKALGAVVAA